MSISTTESFSQRLNPEMPIETYLLKTWKQIGKVQIEHIGEIAQDNIDYLCIGSDRGLLRFDGSQIKAFNFRNPDGEYLNLEEPQYYAKQQFWWKTPVATVAFVLLILLVVILIFRLRTIKKQGVLLKQKVDQQTAELLELNKNLEKKVEGRTREISEVYNTLTNKEERLSLALEKTNTGLFEWYPVTNKTYFSPSWFTMLGYKPGELPENYETWANLLHPEDRSIIEKTVDEFIRLPENSFTAEFRMQTKQGGYIWIYDHGVAVDRDENGQLIRMIGIHSDITKRKLNEEEIRAQETRFQSFVANSNEHVWCVEFSIPVPLDLPEMEQVEHILDYGYYSEVNKAFAEVYGATVEEITGWPLAKTLPRSLPTTVPFLLDVIRSGYNMVDAETIETTKEGLQVFILNSFIGTIENNKVMQVWGTARDITALKLADKALIESEERYRLALDAANEGIWDYDVETDTIKFSPAIYTMLGYEPYEFEESREAIYQLINTEDQQKWHKNYHDNFINVRDEKQFQDEYRIFTKTRELIWVRIKGKVVEWTEENTPKRIVGAHIDITNEKQKNQEILEAILRTEDTERSRIAKNIHDGLQQTLIISSLNFQSAKKEIAKLSSKTKEKFETGWEYLQNSITQSRGLSHALMPKAIADFGLIMACENLVFELEKASEFTSFRFQHNIKNDKIDNRQIEITLFRILQESTNNIIKYAQATKVEIQLREYDDIYMLTIEDNGVGFDVDAANTKMDSMGLRSMHNRLDAVNGSMDISSFPGKGTTILVEINKII